MISSTNKQKELLDFLSQSIGRTGVCPSYDDMRRHLGLHSKSGVHRLITGLEERGLIRRLPHRARAIEIVEGGGDRAEALRAKLLEIIGQEAPSLSASLSVATLRQLIATTRV